MATSGHDDYDDYDYDEDAYREEVMKEVMESYLYGSEEVDEEICIHPPTKVNASLHERFGHLKVFKQPLCLVFTDDEMNFQIKDSVVRQISRIDVAISVIGVCGVYRTGKSYLMNRLAQEKSGFSLGSTIRSETKGIWVWCKPHPTIPDRVLILLDTEGLSDPDKGDKKHDTKLFCLTMLMSSVLIYNMKGVIDQDALDRLSFITKVTKNVSVAGSSYANEEEDKNTLKLIAPHFVLCLRDFFYEFVDEGEMTADEYMESCLEESQNKQTDEYNNIRNSIRTFFPKRKCFVMAMPAINKKLKRLDTLREDELDEDFRDNVKSMVTFVHGLGPKRLDQVTEKLWDGNAFETFLRAYIEELSEGQKMEYGTAMENVGRYHNCKLKVTICREYQAKLENLKLPMPNKLELLDLALFHMNESLGKFSEEVYPFLVDHFEDKVRQTMETMMKDLAAENSRKVQKVCCEYLNRKHEKMVQENKKTYHSKDGMHKYEKDFNELLFKYNKKFTDYDDAERCEALQKFQESLKGQVMELKYQAKLQEEISRYEEELQKRRPFDMAVFMRKEMEKIRIKQEKEWKDQLEEYKKKLNELSPGNLGFFRRLKYLFTGRVNTK